MGVFTVFDQTTDKHIITLGGFRRSGLHARTLIQARKQPLASMGLPVVVRRQSNVVRSLQPSHRVMPTKSTLPTIIRALLH
jgi:hypothetical protein